MWWKDSIVLSALLHIRIRVFSGGQFGYRVCLLLFRLCPRNVYFGLLYLSPLALNQCTLRAL